MLPILSMSRDPLIIYGGDTHHQYGVPPPSPCASAGKKGGAEMTLSNLAPSSMRQEDVYPFAIDTWYIVGINFG